MYHVPGGFRVGLSKEEIIDLALRYVPSEEITDFPCHGNLFCLLIRQLPIDRVLAEEEGWAFNGYGVCTGYSYDEGTKPRGKWIWMHFASLVTFPPVAQVLKLQPPHIMKGRFQSADRSHEIRIVKVAFAPSNRAAPGKSSPADESVAPPRRKRKASPSGKAKNIVAFRTKKTL